MVKARRLRRYLRADDVADGNIVDVVDSGAFRDTEFRDQGLHMKMKLHSPSEWRSGSSTEKTWSFNRTSEDNLLKAFGPDTENWIGRFTKTSIVKQNVRGTLRDVPYTARARQTSPQNAPEAAYHVHAEAYYVPLGTKGR